MKKVLKKLVGLLLAAAMAASLAACGASGSSGSAGSGAQSGDDYETIKIRYGNMYNETTTQGQAVNKAKELIEAGSGGKITVDTFHGGTLGSEKDHIQAQKDGSLELVFTGTAGIGLYVPATAVFESWYAFESIDQMNEAVNKVWDDLDTEFQAQGFKLLGAFYDGPRQILSNKKITSINDLKGLKLRAPGSPLYVNSITALGAQAISMPLGDVYTSLQTGAIDAMEGTVDLITQQKFYEQGKYLIEDSHVIQPLFVTYNLESWNKLTPKAQELIQKSIKESSDYQIGIYQDQLKKNEQTLKDAGIEFMELTDRDKWVSSVDKATQDYANQYGDLGKKIYELVKSYHNK